MQMKRDEPSNDENIADLLVLDVEAISHAAAHCVGLPLSLRILDGHNNKYFSNNAKIKIRKD